MENNLFTIVSTNGKNTKKQTVTANILNKIINDFINDNTQIICIMKTHKKSSNRTNHINRNTK